MTATRIKFDFHLDPQKNAEILHSVLEALKELDLGDGPLHSALSEMRDEIELILLPFIHLFHTLFNSLPKIITKLSYDKHPNLLNGYIPFPQLMDRWREEDPGIVNFLAWNIHSIND